MSQTSTNPLSLRTRLAIAGLVAMLCTGAGVLVAESAHSSKAQVLGNAKKNAKPSCPKDTNSDPCDTTGSVTGIQFRAGGQKGLFKVPSDGRIVAWSITLSKPNSEQAAFFADVLGNKRYGDDPTARLAVLKRKSSGKYLLNKQSPVQVLKNNLGETPIFALNKPLAVKKGRFVGLTIPTWATMLASALGPRAGNSTWIASRPKKACGKSADTASPHQKVGSARAYGCRFDDRLIYRAYFVPNKS